MRRILVTLVAVGLFASGCGSKPRPQAADPTIPIVVSPTVPELTVPPPTSPTTTIIGSTEADLRTRTAAFWAEFRKTALNLETDDLTRLSEMYATPSLAAESLAKFRERQKRRETYRVNGKSIYVVKVESVRLIDLTRAEVTECIADNDVLVTIKDGADRVLDDSLSANRFVIGWVKVEGVWKTTTVLSKAPLKSGESCE